MSLDVDIVGGTTGNKAEVNTSNQLKVILETNAVTNPQNVGVIRTYTENDEGIISGTPFLKANETSQDFRLRVGTDTLLFNDNFNASTQNTTNWLYTFTTLTASQPGAGTLNFGTVQGTAASMGASMRTFQYFPVIGTFPLAIQFTAGQFTAALVTNEVFLMGLGVPSTGGYTPPTDGTWFQITPSGLIGVLNFNGTTTQTGTLATLASLSIGELDKFSIVVGIQEVEFWKNDILLGAISYGVVPSSVNTQFPVASGQPFLSTSLPIFMMKYCTGAVSNTNTMRVGNVSVNQLDLVSNKPWATQQALMGLAGYLGQNGQTQGKTSVWANNTAPTAVALTNTAASFTGLGGIGAILPTLTAQNDGILFSYQNPAPSINITGRNLVITGVQLQGAVSVILAGGPVTYAYALAFGMTSLTQVTTETASFATATTHAPRIVPIGIENYVVTAAAGTLGSPAGITLKLNTPVVVRSGEFVAILARNIGTVTTTGAITVVASIDSYWE